MKQIKTLTILGLLSLSTVSVLSACNSKQPEIERDIYFSEIFRGTGYESYALELTTSAKEKSLAGLRVDFYDAYMNKIYTHSFKKEDVLKENETIVFLNKDFVKPSNNFANESNFINLDDNYIRNKYHCDLMYGNQVVDTIGYKYEDLDIYENSSYVRLAEHQLGREEFRELDYIRVLNDDCKYLGNTSSPITVSEIIEGPKIEEFYGDLPFRVGETAGGGGYYKVRIAKGGLGDGDTTHFIFPSEAGIPNNYENRVRYLYIDTPEVSHGAGQENEPYAIEAKQFNNTRLSNAKSIIVQSEKGGSLQGNFGRTLGLVWYSNVSNPKITDYRLLNHEIAANGLAQISVGGASIEMVYKNITYSTFIRYGAEIAREKGLNIYSI